MFNVDTFKSCYLKYVCFAYNQNKIIIIVFFNWINFKIRLVSCDYRRISLLPANCRKGKKI